MKQLVDCLVIQTSCSVLQHISLSDNNREVAIHIAGYIARNLKKRLGTCRKEICLEIWVLKIQIFFIFKFCLEDDWPFHQLFSKRCVHTFRNLELSSQFYNSIRLTTSHSDGAYFMSFFITQLRAMYMQHTWAHWTTFFTIEINAKNSGLLFFL